MERKISIGNFKKMGVVRQGKNFIFTFVSNSLEPVRLHFYALDEGQYVETEIVDVPSDYRKGKVYSIMLSSENREELLYLIEEDGVLRVDPYATRIYGREKWAEEVSLPKRQVYSGISDSKFSWRGDQVLRLPDTDLFMYRLHLRGFAMESSISKAKKGTYLGLMSRLRMLSDFGVNVLEFQPLYEFDEVYYNERSLLPLNKKNVWGYGPGNYFAPKTSYFGGDRPEQHMREMIRSIHKNGMEIVMEMFFEGVDSNLIMDCLHYWREEYHIDGFRLLGRDIPIKRISEDPYLSDTRLFFDQIPGDVLKDETPEFRHLYHQNSDFLYPLRKLQNHKDGSIIEFANMMKRQNESYGFVNFAASSDGFTLLDAYSYSEKHNEENGENNYDGLNFNYSHNYGVEGETTSRNVKVERLRHIRTALATTILSQAIPLIQAGDTLGNSQGGNNNPYCQDNPTGWVTFSRMRSFRELNQYARKLIQFRRLHPILHMTCPMGMNDPRHIGCPDLSYHGKEPWIVWLSEDMKSIGMFYNGAYGEKKDEEDVMLLFNFYFNEERFQLPSPRPGRRWRYVTNTSLGDFMEDPKAIESLDYRVPGGSLTILVGSDETEEEKKKEKTKITKKKK